MKLLSIAIFLFFSSCAWEVQKKVIVEEERKCRETFNQSSCLWKVVCWDVTSGIENYRTYKSVDDYTTHKCRKRHGKRHRHRRGK